MDLVDDCRGKMVDLGFFFLYPRAICLYSLSFLVLCVSTHRSLTLGTGTKCEGGEYPLLFFLFLFSLLRPVLLIAEFFFSFFPESLSSLVVL